MVNDSVVAFLLIQSLGQYFYSDGAVYRSGSDSNAQRWALELPGSGMYMISWDFIDDLLICRSLRDADTKNHECQLLRYKVDGPRPSLAGKLKLPDSAEQSPSGKWMIRLRTSSRGALHADLTRRGRKHTSALRSLEVLAKAERLTDEIISAAWSRDESQVALFLTTNKPIRKGGAEGAIDVIVADVVHDRATDLGQGYRACWLPDGYFAKVSYGWQIHSKPSQDNVTTIFDSSGHVVQTLKGASPMCCSRSGRIVAYYHDQLWLCDKWKVGASLVRVDPKNIKIGWRPDLGLYAAVGLAAMP